MENKTKLIILICLLFVSIKTNALIGPYNDGARSVAIIRCSKTAEGLYRRVVGEQGLIAVEYQLLDQNSDKMARYEKEFSDYLDEFHDVISYAAEIYGVYYEIKETITCLNSLNGTISKHGAGNMVAVVLSNNRSTVYRELMENSISVIADVKQLFDGTKMTEKERNELISGIRPKIRLVNRTLKKMDALIRFTSLGHVWRELTGTVYVAKSKKGIAEACVGRWKGNYKDVLNNVKR